MVSLNTDRVAANTSYGFTGGKSVEKIQSISGEPWRPEMEAYSKASELGVYDLWQLQRERTALSKVYLDRWTNCEGLDAILSQCLLLTYRLTFQG